MTPSMAKSELRSDVFHEVAPSTKREHKERAQRDNNLKGLSSMNGTFDALNVVRSFEH